jgi:hypothetical protein
MNTLIKTAVMAITFFGISQTLQAQTTTGTFVVLDWMEVVHNFADPATGAYAYTQIMGADKNKQYVQLVAIADGKTPPANSQTGPARTLQVFLTEAAYNRAIDALQRGGKVEFRWDGNATTGYLRQSKN